ncbi:hypothetical protein FB446DRAFT_842865 [Lentinula raphanica]|nr:hypothetical protein FB446DRAFT_842865 [Lentinula raphanica]
MSSKSLRKPKSNKSTAKKKSTQANVSQTPAPSSQRQPTSVPAKKRKAGASTPGLEEQGANVAKNQPRASSTGKISSKQGKKYSAVPIDINGDDSTSEPETDAPVRKKLRSTRKDPEEEIRRQELLEEDGDSPDNSDSDEPEEPEDFGAFMLSDEAVKFTNTAEEEVEESYTAPSRSQGSIIVSSDIEDEVEEPVPRKSKSSRLVKKSAGASQVPKAASSRKLRKLEYELPQVMNSTTPFTVHGSVTKPQALPQVWTEHSNIVVTCRNRTFTLGSLSSQSSTMRGIIEKAIAHGKWKMLFDDTFSPVGPGLKQIAQASLKQVGEDEGFVGKGDVCDRLERGDNAAYIKPLISYVSHRIGQDRNQLKAHSSVVLAAFSLSHITGPGPATNLVHRRTYFYPAIPGVTDESSKYDNRQPFGNPVFKEYIKAAFFSTNCFSSIIQQHKARFVSSIPEKPAEPELPKALVALASTAIHACLQDFSSGVKDTFPTKELDGIWKLAIQMLNGYEKKNRMKYHTLMHNLYKDSSEALASTHGLSNQQVLDAVDWSFIEDEEADDNMDGAGGSGSDANPNIVQAGGSAATN